MAFIPKWQKTIYISSKVGNSKNRVRAFWWCINRELGRQDSRRPNVEVVVDGVVVADPVDCCDLFAKHFSLLMKDRLLAAFGDQVTHSCTTGPSLSATMYFRPVSAADIVVAIKGLKNVSSVGCDDVGVAGVKAVADLVAKPLADILNLSISAGKFPQSLKIGKVSPIFKSGSTTNVDNYRPISVSSVFSKVFESVVKERLCEFFDSFNVLNASQHGFRSGRSTETAAIKYLRCLYM